MTPEETPEVDPLAPNEEAPPPEVAPEDMTVSERANLAQYLDEEAQKKKASLVRHRLDAAVTSRAPRMRKCKDLQKLYAMVAEQKSFPWQNAANVKTPALTGPQLQIQSRLFDMVWPQNGKVFNVYAGTVDEMPVAHISEAFANSYVRYKLPNMEQGLDDTIHQTTLYGSGFRRTAWSASDSRVDSGPVPLEDFVVNYRFRSDDPSMSDVPVYTMIHHLTLGEIEDMGRDGGLVNVDKVKKHASEEDFGGAFREQAQKIDGNTIDPDEDDEDRKRPVLEQHYRWKAPFLPAKHPALDGKYHYVYALVDAWSGELLRLSLREEDDPDDLRRFARDQAVLDEYRVALQTFEAARTQPSPPPEFDPMTGMEMPAPPPQLPPHPGFPPKEPKPVRKRQICFFTHYRCFPSDGFYGLGYGDVLYGIALALNTTINQHIDGMTLKNAKPMLMSKQVRMQRGAVAVQPGSVVEVDGPISAIRDAIMFLDPPPNDPNTVPLIQMLDGMKDAMVGAADTFSGAMPKSNQGTGGVEKLIEQALTPITVLGRRIRGAFAHELAKIWRCFGVFLEDHEIVDIVGEAQQPRRIEISRKMFTPTARLVPTSDPRAKSQRQEDYGALSQYVTSNPYLMQGPTAPAMMRALTEMGLQIFPDGEKLMQYLPPPPAPPTPPPPVPFWDEDAGFLEGKPAHVHPDDVDMEHLQGHMQFGQSQEGSMLAPPMRQALEQHIRDHVAATIRKQHQPQGEMQNGQQGIGPGGGGPPAVPPGGPQGGGPPPMAGPPGQQVPGGAPPAPPG